ncbi:response regulator [Rhodopila sp.]|uniref:response regulator n=1 Tax=Rhodopila sp. TaxID=2480087 RepID=UPI002BE4AA1D|nr:response regulator [Rhodopila sp.]HVZ08858.1 response regulator [Rhodopila sp.]
MFPEGEVAVTSAFDTEFPDRFPAMTRQRRILVVEDQEPLAVVIADVLGDSHEVVCVSNVTDAVDYLLSDSIDLVLLDCVLPDGPNWQVALEADRQQIPVILMTGDAEQAKELIAGQRIYLLKPFAIAALLDAVHRADASPAV